MAYVRTVLAAIGIFFGGLFVTSVALATLSIYRGGATGVTLSRRGLQEALLASTALGWIVGTVWYLARRT
jgi:hypothetical protein